MRRWLTEFFEISKAVYGFVLRMLANGWDAGCSIVRDLAGDHPTLFASLGVLFVFGITVFALCPPIVAPFIAMSSSGAVA